MQRYCFLLRVRPDLLALYRARHEAVWPAMLLALRDSGWHNYSLFLATDGLLVGYVEATDLAAAERAMAATAVNGQWQQEMSNFFVDLDSARPDQGRQLLERVFTLEEQLEQLAVPTHLKNRKERDDER